jgi:hypothetical protein
LALLTACSGTGNFSGSGGSSSTSGTGTTGTGTTGTSTTQSVKPAALAAQSSATSIASDGSTTATITVLALNSSNNLISGVDVSFATSSGGIAVVNGTTNSSGAATATLSTAGDSTPRTITVTATAGGLTATVNVQVVSTSSASTTAVSTLTLASSTPTILSDGTTSATISALARDASNNVLAGVPVTFAASSGALAVTQGTTDATGTALATLTTGDNSTLRTIKVTGSTATLSSTVSVGVVAPSTPTAPVYSMGNGSGTTFVTGQIGLSVTGTLAAGGTTGIQISIVDQTGTLYTAQPVQVTFSSPCIASGLAQILPAGSGTTPVTSITTSTGSIGATYAAVGCSGTDNITASATVASQSVSATGSVTIAQASIGSIQFESASPTTIGLKGTGLGETSTVIFKVTDSTGGARAGVTVSFSLNTTVGGLSLSPTSATSASDGTVQTVVSSGTVHTVVRVTASIASPALSTQSSQLTVTTGLPASAAFSSAVGAATYANGTSKYACSNTETWNQDGVTVPITVYLADRYNNPVPDNTSVAFTTSGGQIEGNCVTANGQCTVTWTSTDPRPALDSDSPDLLAAGRVTILATTIGEESFTDEYGTGFWQTGDPFSNLGEPYSDNNENGVRNPEEYFLDFNHNGQYDGPSGSFVGITCTGITAGSTCTENTLGIGASTLIVMSTGLANISLGSVTGSFTSSGGALSIPASGSGSFNVVIADLNGNAMAAGTSVAVTVTNSAIGAATVTPSPFVLGCDSDIGGAQIPVQFVATSTAGSGAITITVTSPSGSTSTLSIPLTVT